MSPVSRTASTTAKSAATQGKVACVYDIQQPDLLQSGIYLGIFVDPKRRAPAEDNVIIDNLIMGHGMKNPLPHLRPRTLPRR